MGKKHPYDALVAEAFDFAAGRPEGFTVDELQEHLGVPSGATRQTIRRLRHELGTADSINLIADPNGKSERWLYKLVGNYEDAQQWAQNRRADLEGRLETMLSVATSIVRATDGRSKDGKKARLIAKVLGRLVEDLAEIEEAA